MSVLVTGSAGQLGRALAALLSDAVLADAAELDITSRAALAAWDWTGITAIINAAAWTAVDAAEDPERLPTVWDVNVTGVAGLALQARRLDLPLLHLSTDYVLRGDHVGDAPRGAVPDPQGAYGISKAASELAARLAPRHHVVRTSWVFGDGPNFVRTMRRLAADRTELRVVDDQVGRPTYARDLAAALVGLLDSTDYGTHNATGSGDVVSWAGFAHAVLADLPCRVVPVSSADYAAGQPAGRTLAPRPANSALAPDLPMRDWRAALADYLNVETS